MKEWKVLSFCNGRPDRQAGITLMWYGALSESEVSGLACCYWVRTKTLKYDGSILVDQVLNGALAIFSLHIRILWLHSSHGQCHNKCKMRCILSDHWPRSYCMVPFLSATFLIGGPITFCPCFQLMCLMAQFIFTMSLEAPVGPSNTSNYHFSTILTLSSVESYENGCCRCMEWGNR